MAERELGTMGDSDRGSRRTDADLGHRRPVRARLVDHVNGANIEVQVEPRSHLRFDGAFRVVGGAAKVSVWAFHVLDGPHRGACLLFESHWTHGLWPFLSMWGGLIRPTGGDEVDLRRRQAAIITRDA